MKNKKSVIEKQIKNISFRVFEDELESFKSKYNVINESYEREIKVYRSGGIVELKKRYIVIVKVYSNISYEDLVNELVREKYSLSNELAILRQRDTKPEDFSEYNTFVEQCKLIAKEFILERDGGTEDE